MGKRIISAWGKNVHVCDYISWPFVSLIHSTRDCYLQTPALTSPPPRMHGCHKYSTSKKKKSVLGIRRVYGFDVCVCVHAHAAHTPDPWRLVQSAPHPLCAIPGHTSQVPVYPPTACRQPGPVGLMGPATSRLNAHYDPTAQLHTWACHLNSIKFRSISPLYCRGNSYFDES